MKKIIIIFCLFLSFNLLATPHVLVTIAMKKNDNVPYISYVSYFDNLEKCLEGLKKAFPKNDNSQPFEMKLDERNEMYLQYSTETIGNVYWRCSPINEVNR